MRILTEFFSRLASAFFPESCVLCGELTGGGLCCAPCEATCAPVGRSGLSLSADFSAFTLACAGTTYEGAARRALIRLKNTPDKRLAAFFAQRMLTALEGEGAGLFDALVPVPASAEKRKERGFNQAELLANQLAETLNAPVLPNALTRHGSLVQHTLDRKTRTQNAKAAYGINEAALVKGKNILLVDDVVTTGATTAACGALLLKAGAKSVAVAAATATRRKGKLSHNFG